MRLWACGTSWSSSAASRRSEWVGCWEALNERWEGQEETVQAAQLAGQAVRHSSGVREGLQAGQP